MYVFKNNPKEEKSCILRSGGSIIELVRDSIELDNNQHKTNYQLQLFLAEQVMKDNNISDPTTLHP